MFTPEIIKNRLKQQPLTPFRIGATDGLRNEFQHPDLVLVGMRDIQIGQPAPVRPGIYTDRSRVALVHVAALEEMSAAAPASSNGSPPTEPPR
jgi:hypothetical protein